MPDETKKSASELLTEKLDQVLLHQKEQAVTLKTLTDGLTSLSQASVNQHPAGLCQDESCSSCVTSAQELVDAAFAKGQEVLAANLDDALLLAGGEELRQKVTVIVNKGLLLKQQREAKSA